MGIEDLNKVQPTRAEKIQAILDDPKIEAADKVNAILTATRVGRKVPYEDIQLLAKLVSNHGLKHNPIFSSRT
jgi:hypothetical protein